MYTEGRTVEDGRAYANRYVSVLTIADRQVTRWRDYLGPLAVFDALGWPDHLALQPDRVPVSEERRQADGVQEHNAQVHGDALLPCAAIRPARALPM